MNFHEIRFVSTRQYKNANEHFANLVKYLLWKYGCDNQMMACDKIMADSPYGGMIGIGNAKTLNFLLGSWCKILRIHAVYHDAFGYVRTVHGCGPGYCYITRNRLFNYPLFGHFASICFWTFIKITMPDLHEAIYV